MRLIAVVLVVPLLIIGSAFSEPSTKLQSMDLVGPDVGWAATNKEIFWTSDGGATWKNIAPPEASQAGFVSVFFLDSATGWVLLLDPDAPNENPRFRLASTHNGGATWTTQKLEIPPLFNWLTPIANMFFLDAQHGWINIRIASSSAFSPGMLLQTSDGGQSWLSAGGPEEYGDVVFTTLKDGWIAGGPGGHYLYATHDGKNWQEVSLPAPAKAHPANYPVYGLPIFTDKRSGYLPVTYEAVHVPTSTLVLFKTDDGGHTWKPDRVLPEAGQPRVRAKLAVVDSDVINATAYRLNGNVSVTKLSADGKPRRMSFPARSRNNLVVNQLKFVSKSSGWMLTTGGLLATKDGGNTWRDITPSLTISETPTTTERRVAHTIAQHQR